MQGSNDSTTDTRVSEFKIGYSQDGVNFQIFQSDGADKVGYLAKVDGSTSVVQINTRGRTFCWSMWIDDITECKECLTEIAHDHNRT